MEQHLWPNFEGPSSTSTSSDCGSGWTSESDGNNMESICWRFNDESFLLSPGWNLLISSMTGSIWFWEPVKRFI